MFNNIQIYNIKAEDPMINNTSIGKQMHIAKSKETRKMFGRTRFCFPL